MDKHLKYNIWLNKPATDLQHLASEAGRCQVKVQSIKDAAGWELDEVTPCNGGAVWRDRKQERFTVCLACSQGRYLKVGQGGAVSG
jgi:hypothetical protein